MLLLRATPYIRAATAARLGRGAELGWRRLPLLKRPSCNSQRCFSITASSGGQVEEAKAGARDPSADREIEDILRRDLMSRPAKITTDNVSPNKLRLLKLALQDHLPEGHTLMHGGKRLSYMLPGSHLVYFNPQMRESELLPDGTDPAFWPGKPFTRRMWAGGSIEFTDRPMLKGKQHYCSEQVSDVSVRGGKVFVELLRTYHSSSEVRTINFASEDESKIEKRPYIREKRTLVFMEPPEETRSKEPRKAIKIPIEPDYSFKLTPSQRLLFHFSALTYNAHLIHLDPQYAATVEGHDRGLLVHGPLSVVLMLHAVESLMQQTAPHVKAATGSEAALERIQQYDYRNLAPLYHGEPMRVCVRRSAFAAADPEGNPRGKIEAWIEGPDGGLCVKATATTTVLHTTQQ